MVDYIDVAPIREAVLRRIEEGDSFREIALRLGWTYRFRPSEGKIANVNRLRRTLGLYPVGGGKYNTRVTQRTAHALCKALHVDPVDLGL